MDDLLIDLFLEVYDKAPEEIILDMDATDNPLHGDQEGRFYHGHYRSYCYLPLYIFSAGTCFVPVFVPLTKMGRRTR